MHESTALTEATLYFDRFSANDVESFDAIVSDEAKLFIGTEDHEWFVEREQLRRGFAIFRTAAR